MFIADTPWTDPGPSTFGQPSTHPDGLPTEPHAPTRALNTTRRAKFRPPSSAAGRHTYCDDTQRHSDRLNDAQKRYAANPGGARW